MFNPTEYMRRWRKKNRDKANAAMRRWRQKNPGKARAIELRWRYDISVEEYEALFKAQHGCCAICKAPAVRKALCVDHAHDGTRRVRGLLCASCNTKLPIVERHLESALAYLEQFAPAENVISIRGGR